MLLLLLEALSNGRKEFHESDVIFLRFFLLASPLIEKKSEKNVFYAASQRGNVEDIVAVINLCIYPGRIVTGDY